MLAAPIPVDDAERLAALGSLQLLDTEPEERFDRITRMLTLIMQVPMAYVSLVDSDRQWFKSSCGILATETPRDVSFCGHAILSDGPMVIPDAAADERFRDNPLVTGDPYIRFYAGCPLVGPGGYKVGTLCIADHRPRSMGSHEIEVLGEMARLVERELGLVEVVHLQRDLIASQEHLLHELGEAANYVHSLLPGPMDGPVRTRWVFHPSSQLGGDCFGYDWLDPDHFAIYLLDVSGHGVGAALLSVSVANTLRTHSLPETDFRDPSAVLAHLNDVFPMERQGDKYFTIWYGVFERSTRRLTYAAGGHPPALLLTGPSPDRATPVELGMANFPVGMMPGARFTSASAVIDRFGKLFVYSDGVHEVRKRNGLMMTRDELLAHLARKPTPGCPDEVLEYVQKVGRSETLSDDFSLVEVDFA
jgi:sigma-B regulation protein RsbU (phosphoserine phosphatase)